VTNNNREFTKSDTGAQSAWKGFSSQTLYIASRIATDTNSYDFFPEDVEDLVVKKDGTIIEAVQVKNISEDLTLSSLASTKSSRSGEGFFKRVCKLHNLYPSFSKVRIIYFNRLGEEITKLVNGNIATRNLILKKLTDYHEIPKKSADWLISSWVFEKVDVSQLQVVISDQLKNSVAVMAAPDLAQSLLIQLVSDLSTTNGSVNFNRWQEFIYQIGTDIAALDGYYKEYQKSLLRLCDLTLSKSIEQLKKEFEQGISTHPAHIRNGLDFQRTVWLEKIAEKIDKDKAIIVKGVSGQGKSALCYRFLINNYPEQFIFYVRKVESSRQAENLAIALKGIAKHTQNIVVYIDVNPGEQQWILLVKELQVRGIAIPVLISVREEDFQLTRIDSSSVSFEIVELNLSKQEAEIVYESFITSFSHSKFRSFDEAWTRFGGEGPFIEFVYFLTNNQTLKQRLITQIDNLLRESHPDSWFLLLQLVCFAGKTGCSLSFDSLKKEIPSNNIFAAIQRFSNEYLIRKSEDGEFIEVLHPLRAQIVSDILKKRIGEDSIKLMLSVLKCLDSNYVQLFLMDYFSSYSYSPVTIEIIATVVQKDWIACAGLIKTMLWIDVKRYVQQNYEVINNLRMKYGSGWMPYMPLDASGLIRPDEFVLESLVESVEFLRTDDIKADIRKTRDTLSPIHIDYKFTDLLIGNCIPPMTIPKNDSEWSAFGYSLFWFAKRKRRLEIQFSVDQVKERMSFGDIKSRADAILGFYEQNYQDYYNASVGALSERMVEEYCVLQFSVIDNEVRCRFVPQIFKTPTNKDESKNFNHYWKMKLVNLLDQIYPDKDYIDVALVGVDLFKDWGIEAHDYKAHVHKSYRYKSWIVEINGWVKPRVDYYFRPEFWEEYVSHIDQIRIAANILISDTILYIDYLYKKQQYNPVLVSKLAKEISYLKKHLLYELLLPKTAVDPYCLYSEGTKNIDQNTENISSQELGSSIDLYSNFRKSFSDTFRHLISYFDQFVEVLSARNNKQTLDNIKNSFLSQYNLFHSAIALEIMQKEYNKLFFKYRNFDSNFENREMENMLTLVNVWAHVIENPIRGNSISYDAKLLVRKSNSINNRTFKEALVKLNGEAHLLDGKIFIVIDFNPYIGKSLLDENNSVVQTLQKVWNIAQAYNSVRWYFETQLSDIVLVPLVDKVPISGGFQIPSYKILDQNEKSKPSILIPCEIPISLYSILRIEFEELQLWKSAAGYLGSMKMLITQYNQTLIELSSSNIFCKTGCEKFIDNFQNQLSEAINEFSKVIKLPLKALEKVAEENIVESLRIIISAIEDSQMIFEKISKLQKLEDLEQNIDNTVSLMVLLQTYVISGSRI